MAPALQYNEERRSKVTEGKGWRMSARTGGKWFWPALSAAVIAAAAIWLIRSTWEEDELQGTVLILLDTLRADHLSCYGYERETTPVLSRLAEDGVLFERVVSFAPWTLPSVVNLLSGCPPTPEVFDQNNGGLKRSFIESIREAGYSTAAVTEGGLVSSFYGMDRGFSDYHEEEGELDLKGSALPGKSGAGGGIENTFRLARKWLKEHKKEKFFLFIHTYEPHTPYTRRTFAGGMDPGRVGRIFTVDRIPQFNKECDAFNEEELRYLRALYDGGVLESDRHVGAFLDFLEEIGVRDRTLIVVTSDHGEELGEHYPGHSGSHGHSLRDDQVRVPLIIQNPLEPYRVKKVALQARLMDVLPTVAEILDIPDVPPSTGSSLVPMMRGEEKSHRAAYGGATSNGPQRIFVRWLGYKFIRIVGPPPKGRPPLKPPPPKIQLYDLRTDPLEEINLAAREPEIVRRMQEVFDSSKEREAGRVIDMNAEEMDDKLRERLRSLGYIR